MLEPTEVKIQRLQKNLSLLRGVAGWSAEHLADILGVTRQTIVNLESSKGYRMSKMQYIAIRAVLEAESKDNPTLGQVIHLLVDQENVAKSATDEVQRTIAAASSGLGRRAGSAAAGLAAAAALAPVLGAAGISAVMTAAAASSWILSIIHHKDGE